MHQTNSRFPLLILISLGLVTCPLRGHADTVQFPKDNPSFSIELPSGWKAMASSPGFFKEGGEGQLQINPVPASANVTDADRAKAALCDLAKKEASLISGAKCSEVTELTVADQPAFSVVVSGDSSMEYVIFSADGAKWFVGNSMYGKPDQKDFGNKPLLSAIKPLE